MIAWCTSLAAVTCAARAASLHTKNSTRNKDRGVKSAWTKNRLHQLYIYERKKSPRQRNVHNNRHTPQIAVHCSLTYVDIIPINRVPVALSLVHKWETNICRYEYQNLKCRGEHTLHGKAYCSYCKLVLQTRQQPRQRSINRANVLPTAATFHGTRFNNTHHPAPLCLIHQLQNNLLGTACGMHHPT